MLRQFRGLKSCITDLAGGTDLAHMDLFVSTDLENDNSDRRQHVLEL